MFSISFSILISLMTFQTFSTLEKRSKQLSSDSFLNTKNSFNTSEKDTKGKLRKQFGSNAKSMRTKPFCSLTACYCVKLVSLSEVMPIRPYEGSETNKDFKDAYLENGQLVIVRRIASGDIGHGGDGQELAGGYRASMQDDYVRVNLAGMGVAIKNPKELFTEWSSEDYMAIADRIQKNASEMYSKASKDMEATSKGIQESVKRGEYNLNVAVNAAKNAASRDSLVKDILMAYLTGGGMGGVKSMIQDRIKEAVFEKVAEATGLDPQLVKFAFGRFQQKQVQKKVEAQNRTANMVIGGPVGGALLNSIGVKPMSLLNSSIVQASLNGAASTLGMLTGGAVNFNKGLSSLNANRNKLNELKSQETSLVQNAVGTTVATAMGRPDLAGYMGQYLGGIKKRQESKRDAGRLDKQLDKGVGSAVNMANGMVKGIIKNAVVAFGGSSEKFDQLTATPFVNESGFRGADKIDTSRDGLKNKLQEMAFAKALENAGMDKDLAGALSSSTNQKIKAKKAKKEERTKAIEATASTALAVAGTILTAGAASAVAGPMLASLSTSAITTANIAVQTANIALQAAIGSRKGGSKGAIAGALNGTLQALAGGIGDKLSYASKFGKLGQQVSALANKYPNAAKLLTAVNVSYDKKNGLGVKVNAAGAIASKFGAKEPKGFTQLLATNLSDFSIGNNQRTGLTLSGGLKTPIGNIGMNYSQNLNSSNLFGQSQGHTLGVSVDVTDRSPLEGTNVGVTLNYDNQDGFSTDVEMAITQNPMIQSLFALNVNIGRTGAQGSVTNNGSTMGTVDQNGNYEANENFLAEMNGHDIAESVQSFNNANDNKPVKDSNDDSSNNRDGDDGKPAKEDRPSDLLGVALVGGALFATTVAGAFASNPSTPRPSTPNSGSSGQVNNPVRPMRRRDEDSDSDSNGGRKPTEAELDNFRNNIFFNTTKAETERILKKLESEGIDTSEMRKFAEEQRNRGVRNLTAEEIKVKNLEKELAKLQKELENASKLATDTISIPTTLSDADVNPMAYIVREQKRLEDLKRAKEAELNKIKNDPIYKNIVENANRNAELQIQLDNKKKDDIKKIEKEIRERISGRENVFNLNDPVNLEAYKNVFDNFKKIKTLLDCSLELQKLLKYEIKNESLAKIDEYYRARSDMFNFENFLFNKYKKELNLNTPIKEKEFREAVRLYKHSELLNARIIENNKNLPDKSEKGEIQLNPKVINPLTGKLGGTLTVNSGMGYRTLGGKPNIHYGFDLKPKNEVFSFTGGRIVGETLGSIETTPIGARGIYLNKDGNVCYLNSNEEETIHPDSESLKKKHAGKLDGYGNSITIKTLAKGQAFKVKYAHLEEPFKRKPDRIFLQQGDSIGISSSTGMSTGAHNHIEIEVVDPLKTEIPEQYLLKKGDKTYVDPIYYLNHIQGYQNEYEEGMNSFINNSPFTQNLDNPNLRFNN